MEKKYNHKQVEEKIYKLWEEGGHFTPEIDAEKESYTMVLPPPNSNGKLHVGHALMIAIEDLLIRWKRLQGYSALWIPGRDHAGFETQAVFERHLKAEGKSRMDFDRKTLYDMIYNFVEEQGNVIYKQIRSLGPSLDWTRGKFTLDEDVVTTVYGTFKKMHDDGMIYRDNYMVNYCTHCGTTLSELEIDHKDKLAPLHYIKYRLLDRKETEPEYLVVATTRPEPIFVDTHLAINPSDESKSWLVGRQLENPLTGSPMTVVAADFVDPEFGTGLVKLTPAHDKNDYQVAKELDLPIVKAIEIDGKMIGTDDFSDFEGLYPKQARKKAVEILEKKGLVEKIDEKYTHSSSLCYKCKNVIEPMVLPNWFVDVSDLKEPAHQAVKSGDVRIFPKWQEVKYHRWMEEMHDWPISRQIVWGIRIPIWYKVEGQEEQISVTFIDSKGKQTHGNLKELISQGYSLEEIRQGLQQCITSIHNDSGEKIVYEISHEEPLGEFSWIPETDTFDTWFSSGHWPLVTLGYPDSADFKYFYPTAVLETGWEILRFWVSRMIMFGIYLTGKAPFSDVYLHGLVMASDGRKMSKSLGNQVDPLDYVEEFGADALRMGLISGTAGGKDFSFPHDKVLGYRNFANKIWNMTRFMNMLIENDNLSTTKLDITQYSTSSFNDRDREIVSGLNTLIQDITSNLEDYRFAQAGEDIYHFMWDELASNYIEDVKSREDKKVGLAVLYSTYRTCLILLHPFMPFVTEELWSNLPVKQEKLLINETWPTELKLADSN